jgi:RsiW-degrading membrane proteinase PrsW (M82 family)
VPLIFYFVGRYRSEAAGIVLGVVNAAGFAGLETMGYGFVSLLTSKDNLGVLDEVLLVRGLTSPAGHMAWTGLVCALLWRETQGGACNPRLAGTLLSLLVALVSLVLLLRRVREARQAEGGGGRVA